MLSALARAIAVCAFLLWAAVLYIVFRAVWRLAPRARDDDVVKAKVKPRAVPSYHPAYLSSSGMHHDDSRKKKHDTARTQGVKKAGYDS